MKRTIHPDTLTSYQALAAGLSRDHPSMQFLIAGQSYTSAEAEALVRKVLLAATEVAAAKARLADARTALQKTLEEDAPTVEGIRTALRIAFTRGCPRLMVPPRKPRRRLTEGERATATAKAKATHEARRRAPLGRDETERPPATLRTNP